MLHPCVIKFELSWSKKINSLGNERAEIWVVNRMNVVLSQIMKDQTEKEKININWSKAKAKLWVVLCPEKIYWSPKPRYLWLIWFGSRLFVDVIKLRWGHTALGWALRPVVSVLVWRPHDNRDTHREGHVTTDAETRVMHPGDTEDCWQPSEGRREAGWHSSRPSESGPCWLVLLMCSVVVSFIFTTGKTKRPVFVPVDISEDWGSSTGPCLRGVASSKSGSGEGYKHQSHG